MQIAFISSEVDPFSKAGGLGDVARSLPKALKRLGHRIIVITPLYHHIDTKKFGLNLIINDIPLKIDETTTRHFAVWQGWLMEDLPIYFIDSKRYFSGQKRIYGSRFDNRRFFFFDLACLELLKTIKFAPEIIQCNDWQTGLIPYFLRKRYDQDLFFKNTNSVFTIHNLVFQSGHNWWSIPNKLKDLGHGRLPRFQEREKIERINFAKRAIIHADMINTVSEQYAEEIMTKNFGQDLHNHLKKRSDRLFGIVNGIDYDVFNPAQDPGLRVNYDANHLDGKRENKSYLQSLFKLPVNPNIPVIGMATRISEQKGFDLIMDIIDPLMRLDFQLVLVGGGEKMYEKFIRQIRQKHPTKVAAHLQFSTKIATLIYAGSDLFLMPSRFEPCGLGQLISSRYGSIPIVRATGGLADTIKNYNAKTESGNGFVFKSYDSRDMLVAIARGLENYRHHEKWQKLVKNAMEQSFGWEVPAQKYETLFSKALKLKKRTR
ncbi:glycogen synthase [Patescibacteria group bacterium]|nr:glycogen synthase [Patescibacteria group bacterium]